MSGVDDSNTKKGSDLRTVRLSSVSDLPADFKVHTDVHRWSPYKWIPVLNLYIFTEIIGPFVVALSFFTMIYMAMALQKMVGLIVGKGVDPIRLLDYFSYVVINTLPNTIPMACLMSGIMAAGRLSGDSEITAMRSAGVSFGKIYSNFLFFGFIMALLVAYLNFEVVPRNTMKMDEFNNWIVAYNPMLAVTPGQFSGDNHQETFQSRARTMYTEGLNRETGQLRGVQIREWEIFLEGNEYIRHNNQMIPMGGSSITQIISAKKGYTIEKLNSNGKYEKSIRLQEGFLVEWDEKRNGFSIVNFLNGEMDYNLPSKSNESRIMNLNVKPETFSFPMLFHIRNSIQSEGLEKIPGLEILKEYGLSIKGIKGLKDLILQMKLEIIKGAAEKSLSPEELSNRFAVYTQLTKLLKDSQKTSTATNIEINRRVAMPISCQIFFFLSFPLGLVVKRSGKGMSFTLAVIFLFIYYALFIAGENISYNPKVPDWIGPWLANITIAILSIYIMLSRTDITLKDTLWGKAYLALLKKLQPVSHFFSKIFSPIGRIFTFLWKYIRPVFFPLIFLFRNLYFYYLKLRHFIRMFFRKDES